MHATKRIDTSQDYDHRDLGLIDNGFDLPSVIVGPSSEDYQPQFTRSSEAPNSDTAVAPQRRKARMPKVLPIDYTTELRNSDLLSMSNTYTVRMSEERQTMLAKKAAKQIKNNPLHFILSNGINGVGAGIGKSHGKTPLSNMFSGTALFELVTGRALELRGQKRESEEEDPDTERRRVRPRLDENDQIGRGDWMEPHEDDDLLQLDNAEMGRDASDGREDMTLPWNNITTSLRGSSALHGALGSVTGLQGSAAGSLGRRGSRMISASPLHGRPRLSGLEPLLATGGFESDAVFGGELGALGGPSVDTEFEMFDGGATVHTQTAAWNSWQQSLLARESINFLGFIENAIHEGRAINDQFEDHATSVDFEELLPTSSTSRVVAAQALMHVLSLATKSLINANQVEEYGAIKLNLVHIM
jgi:meiotic recombination protein REC8